MQRTMNAVHDTCMLLDSGSGNTLQDLQLGLTAAQIIQSTLPIGQIAYGTFDVCPTLDGLLSVEGGEKKAVGGESGLS